MSDMSAVRQAPPRSPTSSRSRLQLVWYVSYGSNMYAHRLMCYIAGGTPPGARLTYPGCRDRRPPRRAIGCLLGGGVYFATESATWGGGRAFYDPDLVGPERIGPERIGTARIGTARIGTARIGTARIGTARIGTARIGTAAARAYLITAEQFGDIAAQEMYRAPGMGIDLGSVLATGRVELGSGRYETLLHVGDFDGHPALTFTAPWHAHDVPWTAPSAPYLRMLIGGLREAHGWDVPRAAGYITRLPGARGHWTPAAVAAL